MEATHKNGCASQTPHDESIQCISVEDALSNFLILRMIFTFLNEEDLESCCHVCQDWRTVADPLVVPHFGNKLAKTFYDGDGRLDGSHVSAQLANCKHNIVVREGARYNRKSFTQRTDLGVAQILEVILTQKVSISLTLSGVHNIQDDEVIDFLSKIGPLVLNLDMQGETSRGVFCKLLLQKFPNLKELNCCGFRPNEDYLENHLFDPDLPQNKHKWLRKILIGNNPFHTYLFVETMLKMSENLETIEDFPLKYINAIVVARKGPALKSLLNDHYSDRDFQETGETVVTAFEKLASLQPKLTSLVFTSDRFDSKETFNLVKPFLFSALQSSHESLGSLQIAPLRSDEVQNLPTLKGLQQLDLLKHPDDAGVFFTLEMPVEEKFPNVFNFGSSNHIWNDRFIKRRLPEKVMSPWGTQITELSVNRLTVSAIPSVHRRFPSIQKLELKNSLVDLPNILLELSRFWPQLKSLTISCDKVGYEQMNLNYKDYRKRLDHAFTGLPFKVIHQLEYPSRNKNFTAKQTRGFKDRSIISKLKELRELKIFLSENFDSVQHHGYISYTPVTYMRLTSVANEFGFKLLPELTVTLVVEKLVCFAEEMKRDLKPLAYCSNIEIVNAKDGYPYVF